jgi:hypothetical protein
MLGFCGDGFTRENKTLFTLLRAMGFFFRSKAPGLVFSEEKDGGLPPVTSEKPHDPLFRDILCKQWNAPSRDG